MRKLFTIVLFLSLCIVSRAQDLTVTVDGKPVSNGEVVISSRDVAVELNGEVYSWELKPVVNFISEKGTDIQVTVTNLGDGYIRYWDGVVVTDPTVAFCGIKVIGGFPSGTCEYLHAGEKFTHNQILPANVTGVGQIYMVSSNYAHPVPMELRSTSAIKVVYGRETLEFTLKMEYKDPGIDTGIEGVASEGVDFKIIDGAVVADEEVEVYDLTGSRVENMNLNGIYVVRIADKSTKVIVK
ncbi:MAG: hypothetical protein K2G11_02205 [Muribaculaceae bacterium]|nr:hypothetical protein [Muribaculaceae bacterium]